MQLDISAQPVAHEKRPFSRHLYFQVIIAFVAGLLLGHFYPQTGEALKPLGDGFIKLVKTIIAPVIFLTIVTGLAGMGWLRGVGSVVGKAFAYFLTFSTLALVVGLIVANVVQPGSGMNIDPASLDEGAVSTYTEKAHESSLTGFVMDIILTTLVSFVEGNILQVLFVAILFGIGLILVGDKGKPVLNILESASFAIFRVVYILMKTAPIGAFGAFAFTIGKYGTASIMNLAMLVGTFYLTLALFVIVILGTVCMVNGFSIFRPISYLKAEILLVTAGAVAGRDTVVQGRCGRHRRGFHRPAATLSVVPTVPVAGMALILGVDRFMSECRSITNFIGNAVATVVVSRWHSALDRERFDAVMGGQEPEGLAAPVTGLALHPAGLQLGERSAD